MPISLEEIERNDFINQYIKDVVSYYTLTDVIDNFNRNSTTYVINPPINGVAYACIHKIIMPSGTTVGIEQYFDTNGKSLGYCRKYRIGMQNKLDGNQIEYPKTHVLLRVFTETGSILQKKLGESKYVVFPANSDLTKFIKPRELGTIRQLSGREIPYYSMPEYVREISPNKYKVYEGQGAARTAHIFNDKGKEVDSYREPEVQYKTDVFKSGQKKVVVNSKTSRLNKSVEKEY